MHKIKALFTLIRFPNLVFIFLTQLLAWYQLIRPAILLQSANNELILSEGWLFVLALSTVLIAAAGYIINDYFDIGIANNLLKRGKIEMGSESFGHAFEHFIYQELYAHSNYTDKNYPISYWRTTSQIEVDFILGDHEVAVEVKGTDNVQSRHIKGLKSFSEEYKVKKLIVVSNDPLERKMGDITVMPWKVFLEKLWANKII